MSTKPATLPRWADVGGALVTPAAGKLNVGWVPGDRPPAQYKNWLQYWNYKWIEYLNDGALQGAHTFSSTVGVTGLITATAGVTCAANQHVTVSGTGELKHGARTLTLDIAAGQRALGTVTYDGLQLTFAASSEFDIAIPLKVGDRITALRFYFSRDSGAAVTCSLRRRNLSGPSSTVICSKTINTGTLQNTDIGTSPTSGSLPHTVATATSLCARMAANNLDDLIGVEVTYDRP